MTGDNYYKILDIEVNATDEDIKRAYRHLVLKYHPDKNSEPYAEEIFRQVQKAYDVLSSDKRIPYDESLKKEALLNQRTVSQNVGADLRFSIKVNVIDLIKGYKKTVPIKRKGRCLICDGTGSQNKKIKKCNFCNGTGLQGLPLILGQKKKCTYCGGIGHRPQDKACLMCKGSGLISELIRHEIQLSPFTYVITISGMGDYPIGAGRPGDLTIELDVKQDSQYKLKGLDISGTVGISPAQAVLGDTVLLNVFDKETEVIIPPGTQHNEVIEQEGGGISYEGKTGIFKATIKIVMPDIITEEEKTLYNQLLSLEKGQTQWPKILSL